MLTIDVEAEIRKCEPQIRALVKEWGKLRRRIGLADMRQEIALAFVEAAAGFNHGEGIDFSARALRIANQRLYDLARVEKSGGQHVSWREGIVEVEPISLDRLSVSERDTLLSGHAVMPKDHSETVPPNFWERIEGALTPQQYKVIRLRFVEGLTHDEVAARLGIVAEASRQLEERGVARLGDRLSWLIDYLGEGRGP